jgi:hypothetical protein
VVAGEVVEPAPQPWVLRDGEDRTALRFDGAKDSAEGTLVVVDVLQHIECAHDVERLLERHSEDVELEETDIWKPPPRNLEPFGRELGPGELELWQRVPYTPQDEARSAADLEEGRGLRERTRHGRDDQCVSAAEPEAFVLGAGKGRDELGVERAVGGGRQRRSRIPRRSTTGSFFGRVVVSGGKMSTVGRSPFVGKRPCS